MFEAFAAEVIGGYAPQVRYRTASGRWLVIWQGEVITYRDAPDGDGRTHAENLADHRIAMALVGLFQDEKIAALSRAVLRDDQPPELAASKGKPVVAHVGDGQFQVTDGTFEATYDDYKVAERVAAWLADESDERQLRDVIGADPPPARPEPAAPPVRVRDTPQA